MLYFYTHICNILTEITIAIRKSGLYSIGKNISLNRAFIIYHAVTRACFRLVSCVVFLHLSSICIAARSPHNECTSGYYMQKDAKLAREVAKSTPEMQNDDARRRLCKGDSCRV